MLAHDPRRLLRDRADRHVLARSDVGRHDERRRRVIPELVAMMHDAGPTTSCTTTAGGHDWIASTDAVADSLPPLAETLAAGSAA